MGRPRRRTAALGALFCTTDQGASEHRGAACHTVPGRSLGARLLKPPRRFEFPLAKAMALEGCEPSAWGIWAPGRRAAPTRDGLAYTFHALTISSASATGARGAPPKLAALHTSPPSICLEGKPSREKISEDQRRSKVIS